MAGPDDARAPALARHLGLPEGADEGAVIEAIRRPFPWPAIAEALGLPSEATPAECVAAAGLL